MKRIKYGKTQLNKAACPDILKKASELVQYIQKTIKYSMKTINRMGSKSIKLNVPNRNRGFVTLLPSTIYPVERIRRKMKVFKTQIILNILKKRLSKKNTLADRLTLLKEKLKNTTDMQEILKIYYEIALIQKDFAKLGKQEIQDQHADFLKNKPEYDIKYNRVLNNPIVKEKLPFFRKATRGADLAMMKADKIKAIIDEIAESFKKSGIDNTEGFIFLRKIIKDQLLPPISGGECFMFTAVSAFHANNCIKENYEKLQETLKKDGTMGIFNEGLKTVYSVFKKKSVRQPKHIPKEITDWMEANKKAIITTLLHEMLYIITSFPKENLYQEIFLHSRILRFLIKRKNKADINFKSGGNSLYMFKTLLEYIDNNNIKNIETLHKDSIPPSFLFKEFGDNTFGSSLNANKFFTDADSPFFLIKNNLVSIKEKEALVAKFYEKNKNIKNELSKELKWSKAQSSKITFHEIKNYINKQNKQSLLTTSLMNKLDNRIIKEKRLLNAPKYRANFFSIALPDHALSYERDKKTNKWFVHDIAETSLNIPLEFESNANNKLNLNTSSSAIRIHENYKTRTSVSGIIFSKI